MKDNDSTQKNTEDQNRCIELFVHGTKEKAAAGDKPLLGKRDSGQLDVFIFLIKKKEFRRRNA